MTPQTHELKTLSRYFQAVKRGEKTFEVRKNDRAFQTGDLLLLREVREDALAGSYTDATLTKRVTYLLQGGQFGIEPAYCILGLGDVEPTPSEIGLRQGQGGSET